MPSEPAAPLHVLTSGSLTLRYAHTHADKPICRHLMSTRSAATQDTSVLQKPVKPLDD